MIPSITDAFGAFGITDIRATRAPRDEIRIAAEAVSDDCGTIVVVGGDGTVSNVANVVLHSGKDIRITVLPAGTGNDMAKVLGTSRHDAASIAALCASAPVQRMDVGKIEDVYFVNCCGFGFDVAVLEGIIRNKRLRGSAVYVYTALRELFGYRASTIGITSEGSRRPAAPHLLLVLANAAYFGGTFEIAPGALPTDGRLDAISILDVPAPKRVAVLASAMIGEHERFRECVRERAPEFVVTFAAPPTYETDGELHHAASATLTVTSCPSALSVVAARPIA
jgi:diacylglycerol kinase (ATP)